ncbi:hypothetical protein [Tenacibaculum jejuense]|uniref:Probable lipoprotein n=1 Tax=Tenacibaculum jejuense TaxID=584609 RepID=A0A238UAD8_9FLAO|nr:hypothetical protein [Tenacibaculum jejuense]SNR15444.1 Probable lipoprotein precursor [Tenacibaculum jejuense]
MKRISYIIILCLIVTSCNTLPKKDKLYQSYTTLDLGVLGLNKKGIRKSQFQVIGVPEYSEKIKLSTTLKSFNTSNYKSYKEYIKNTSLQELIEYNDSLEYVPNYVQLEIQDKVAIVNTINANNENIRDYLLKNPELAIITTLKVVGRKQFFQSVKKANAFYLQTLNDKQQFLLMYDGDKLLAKVSIASLQTFEYELSSFCWNVSDRETMKVVGIVSEGEKCKNGLTRNPRKQIIKKLNEYKFY